MEFHNFRLSINYLVFLDENIYVFRGVDKFGIQDVRGESPKNLAEEVMKFFDPKYNPNKGDVYIGIIPIFWDEKILEEERKLFKTSLPQKIKVEDLLD